MKGLGSTQSAYVLLERPVTIRQVETALGAFPIAGRRPATDHWEFSGPLVAVPYRPQVNGYIVIDTFDHPWPDTMGDPKQAPFVFGAWAMGFFGPCVYPGNMLRAAYHHVEWDGAEGVPPRQKAAVRVRSTYAIGSGPDDKVLPEDYDPAAELLAVTQVTAALCSLPGALCYFNPNGETLRSADQVREALAKHRSDQTLPLDLWRNVRVFGADGCKDWAVADTVGMGQLDAPDHEAVFPHDAYSADDVAAFMYGVTSYITSKGPVINSGDTADGPGNVRWQALSFGKALSDPPREVMRWFPLDGKRPPDALVTDEDSNGKKTRKLPGQKR